MAVEGERRHDRLEFFPQFVIAGHRFFARRFDVPHYRLFRGEEFAGNIGNFTGDLHRNVIFDWNVELARFQARVGTYFALMSDVYPSTEEHQYVRLELPYPGAPATVNRWLPLVKWFLAIPHYIVLVFLYLAGIVVVVLAWFTILFTGRYPRGMFEFVEGVLRWHNRVVS